MNQPFIYFPPNSFGIMGFLSRLLVWLFGRAKQQTKQQVAAVPAKQKKMALAEVSQRVDERLSKARSEAEAKIYPRFAEIKHILRDLEATLNEIEKRNLQAEHGSQRLRKIAQTSKGQLASKIRSLSKSLAPPQQKADFESIREYCMRSSQLISHEIALFRKNIAITSLLMKEQVKSMGECFEELHSIFSDLNSTLQSPAIEQYIKLRSSISGLADLIEKKNEAANLKSASEAELGRICLKKKSAEAELDKIASSEDAKQLQELESEAAELEAKKAVLKSQLGELFAGVEKPLRKMLGMSLAGRYVLGKERESLTRKYLESPLDATKQDIKGQAVKEILSELKTAIGNGTITLKDRDVEKRIAAIDRVLEFDFFSGIFWELNRIEKESKDIEKKRSALSVSEKVVQQHREITSLSAKEAEAAATARQSAQRFAAHSKAAEESVQKLEKELAAAGINANIRV